VAAVNGHREQEGERPRGRTPLELRGLRALVVGLARSGRAAVDLLLASGSSVVATDLKATDELRALAERWSRLGARVVLGENPPALLDGADVVVLSPGVPLTTPLAAEAARRGVRVIGELELAFAVSRAAWLGVTGTNGKTTTTALTGELVRKTGRPVLVGGNIGVALADRARGIGEDGYIVAEVSSFQLDTIEAFRPKVAVLLNVTEDHLDRYPSLEAYAASKRRIFMNQSEDDFAVLNVDDPAVAAAADTLRSRVVPVSAVREVEGGVFARNGLIVSRVSGREERILPASELGIPGPHNLSNALAATAAAMAVGVTAGDAADALRAFSPLEHRLERVAEIDGVAYVNDSKATNVDSVSFALRSYDRPIVLIAGGRDKETDFSPLASLAAGRVKRAVLIGEAAPKLEAALRGVVPTERAATLHDAVRASASAAAPGDVVLLSPACASFDMFADYEDRGRQFKTEVAGLAAERRAPSGGGQA
jgi:UDP-N-acetylmuramoylalanine--D-glutamate ligase